MARLLEKAAPERVKMKHRHSFTTIVFVAVLLTIGCSPIENQARDASAALGGAIKAAQTQHQAECTEQPSLPACVLINRAVDGQNALITSLEAYCGWTAGASPQDSSAKCVPVSGSKGALNTAIANANTFITQLKGVIK